MSRIALACGVGPHDRELGERVGENRFGHGPPLGRVAVEQAIRLVAADDGGELPAEIRRVDQPQAEPLAAERRMDVRRISREQNTAQAVRVDEARVVGPAAGLLHRRHADLGAADPAQHVFDLIAGDGRLAIGRRTAEVRDEVATSMTEALAASVGRPREDPDAHLAASLLAATWTTAFVQAHLAFRRDGDPEAAQAAFLAIVDRASVGMQAGLAGTPYAQPT